MTRAPRQDDHYSYAVYADPAMAEGFDSLRFSGPIGTLLAETQESIIAGWLAPLPGRRILDVGTGTGRGAIALGRRGATVTGLDASAEMLAVARRRAGEAGVGLRLARGDVHAIAFGDRSFEAVVCLRVLMHTPEWRRSLAELCRVAGQRLVFDYPALVSAAALQAVGRRVRHRFDPRVEAYRVFTDRAVGRVLRAHGFRVRDVHRQFVLPIALHKRLGSRRATEAVEGVLHRVGLTHLLGSPVTVMAERCASS